MDEKEEAVTCSVRTDGCRDRQTHERTDGMKNGHLQLESLTALNTHYIKNTLKPAKGSIGTKICMNNLILCRSHISCRKNVGTSFEN